MNTQSKEVNLTKGIQTDEGWRWSPVVLTAKGHVRADLVLVKGVEERHPEGIYYIEWRQNGERIRQSVGKDATEARNQRQAKEAELNATNAGVPILAQTGDNGNRVLLTVAVAEFLEETLTKKPKTHSAYSVALQYFSESCHKLYIQDIERKDLLKFIAFLRDEKGQSARSVYNKFEVLNFRLEKKE